MREILFRGKAIDGNWYYGVPLVFTDDYVCMTAPHTYNKKVEQNTLGQYTGLTDKNGTKIFEGDIIQSFQHKTKKYVCSVVKCGAFRPDMFYKMFEMHFNRQPNENIIGFYVEFLNPTREQALLTNASKLIEVIGNIHDNPELLKEGENG